jgi:hypothetical protein
MRNETKGYILKEYGAWSVLIIAYLIGLGVSRGFTWQAIPVFIALALLINSKQPFMKWTRRPSARKPLVIFLVHIAIAAFIFVTVFGSDILMLLPLLVFPAAYLALNRLAGEHFVLTEALGFVLLSLAAVLAKFTITGGVDIRLFVAVALYFTAGVFKVKAVLLKKTRDRVATALYVVFAAIVYQRFHIALIALLPLADNLIVAATLYRVKLQTTGWIEVTKSLLFLVLMVLYF